MLKPVTSDPNPAPDSALLHSVEIVTFDRALADRYLRLYAYDKQRQVRPLHVNELAAEMLGGRFEPTNVVALAHLGRTTFLINAQHTLSAIVQTGIAYRLAVMHFQCVSAEQAGRLYAAFDIQKTRLAVDRLKALGVTEELPLTPREIGSVTGGLKLILAGFADKATMNGDDKGVAIARSAVLWAHAFDDYEAELQEYLGALAHADSYATKKTMLRGAVVAVALATLKHQRAKAVDFWLDTAADDRLPSDHPAHTLARFIIDSKNKPHGRGVDGAAYVAGAWNAAFEERPLRLLRRIDSGKVGLTIKGTPFKARDRWPKARHG